MDSALDAGSDTSSDGAFLSVKALVVEHHSSTKPFQHNNISPSNNPLSYYSGQHLLSDTGKHD